MSSDMSVNLFCVRALIALTCMMYGMFSSTRNGVRARSQYVKSYRIVRRLDLYRIQHQPETLPWS